MSSIGKKVNLLCKLALEDGADRDSLKNQLREILDKEDHKPASVEATVRNALRNAAVPTGIQGYTYLVEAVSMAVADPFVVRNMTRSGGVYELIAKKYNSTASRIERGVRHGIELSFSRGDPDVLYEIFRGSISPLKGKPTNREFISTIAECVREEVLEA